MANTAKDIYNGTLYARDEVTSNNIIRMYKGDSFFAGLYLNKGTLIDPVRYELTENDQVYFGVAEVNQQFSKSLIRKIYDKNSPVTDQGNIQIELTPDETQYLLPGTYYYSIKVVTKTIVTTTTVDPDTGEEVVTTTENEEVNTVMPKQLFYIQD